MLEGKGKEGIEGGEGGNRGRAKTQRLRGSSGLYRLWHAQPVMSHIAQQQMKESR